MADFIFRTTILLLLSCFLTYSLESTNTTNSLNDSEVGTVVEESNNDSMTESPPKYSPSQLLLIAASNLLKFKVGMAIHRYYLPVIIGIGMIGNFLSLAVMLRRHNRRISCCVYMAALAVTDSCSLFVGGYYWFCTDIPPPIGRPLVK